MIRVTASVMYEAFWLAMSIMLVAAGIWLSL
jgi:hypothetical protein